MRCLLPFFLLIALVPILSCASQKKAQNPPGKDIQPQEERAAAQETSGSAKSEAAVREPVSLGGIMARMAQRAVSQIPKDNPWMIIVSVQGADHMTNSYEKAIANSLVHQLQKLSGEEKCFMVSTPEIRKQILEEQADTLSDLYSEDTGAEIGNLTRADAVLSAPLQKFSDHLLVTLHLVSSDTGAVLWSDGEKIPYRFLPEEEKLDPEILYSSYRSGSHAIRSLSLPPNTAGLEVMLDSTQVVEGRAYNIECKTGASGYLYLFVLQTDGTLAVILPNQIPLESLEGGFMDNHLSANGKFTTRGNFELIASIPGKETVFAVLTEHRLDTSTWTKVYSKELGEEYPQYHWYTFGRNGTIRDSLEMLMKQLKSPATGYWSADWKEFSIVR